MSEPASNPSDSHSETSSRGGAGPNVRLRRSEDRGFEDFGWADNWMTFSFADYHDPDWVHFGPLRVMVENHIQPHEGFSAHPHSDVEILTYVSSGTLTHGDSFGNESGISAGEMQLISAGSRGMVHSEENRHDVVEHNYQMWLVPDHRPTEFAYHELGYSEEERRGRFRLYVSPDGREESMPVNTDAFVYAGLFAVGDRSEHPLRAGRGAWVQVVHGALEIAAEGLDPAAVGGGPDADPGDGGEGGDAEALRLEAGDGAGITASRDSDLPLELTFSEESEVLLFDLGMDAELIWT